MRRRLAKGFAVSIASGALLLAPMAATASADVVQPDGTVTEFDRVDPSERVSSVVDDRAE